MAQPLLLAGRDVLDPLLTSDMLGTCSRLWLCGRMAGVGVTLYRRLRSGRAEYVRCKHEGRCPWENVET